MSIFKKQRALTFLEVIIFIGLFGVITLIIYPLIVNTLNFYFSSQGVIDINRDARNIVLALQRESNQAKSLNLITDWEVIFEKFNNKKSAIFKTHPVEFNTTTNKLKGKITNLRIGAIDLNYSSGTVSYSVNLTPTSSCSVSSTVSISNAYSFSGYAWSPIIGWVKFRNDSDEPVVYGVCLATSTNEVRGYAYNDVVGWIVFNCLDLNVCSSSNFKVKLNNGYLEGFAWNDVLGWLFFDGSRGKVYLANLDQNYQIIELRRITNPLVNVKELLFEKIGNSLRIDVEITDEKQISVLKFKTVISLPFK